MFRAYRRVLPAAALSLAAAATLAGNSTYAAARPTAQTSNADLVAARIHTMAFMTFPSSYGGLRIDDASDITVFVSKADSTLMSHANGLAVGGQLHVRYVPVRHSFQELTNLEEQMVTTDQPTLSRDGVTVVDVHPDVASNRLLVTLLTPAAPDAKYIARAQRVLDSLYGADLVTVNKTTMLPPNAAYRYDDFAPFWGGDQIGASGYGNYTSGFSVYSSVFNTNAVLTAGHCWPTSATVYIDCVTPPQAVYCGSHGYGFGNQIGNVIGRAYPPSGGLEDYEIIGASSAADVWGGTYAGQTVLTVKGVQDPPVGTYMSLDGSVTGEVGNLQVTESQGCVLVNYPQGQYSVCHVGSATGSSAPCTGGDSGGPAYIPVTGGVNALGTIISVSGNTCWFQDAWWEQINGNMTILTG